MNAGFALDFSNPKPLPALGRDEKLPASPPADIRDSHFSPPPPPPKIIHDSDYESSRSMIHPAPLPTLPSLGFDSGGLNVPLTPTSPGSSSPTSPSSDAKPKKSNPLIDLVETEKLYVDQLTGVIRKVAAAWSRSNLPPPELDSMFRSVESVYKANRSLLSKLKEIGTNPSSPKALGDLLMRWVDDLDGPYTTYCSRYCNGFDTWEPVQSNPRLLAIMEAFSASNPPHLSALINSNSSEDPLWTLDTLFLLPKARLKYYRKLYSRLLKSTTPGRSDHRLLLGALDKLDKLLATLESRSGILVGSSRISTPLEPPVETDDEVVIDMRAPEENKNGNGHLSIETGGMTPGSASSSARGSSLSSGERLSRDTASTSISRGSAATLSMPITDLEWRLSTERTLDIFTMKPKVVRLQMSPPSLTYTRELKLSADVVIRFMPRSTGEEVIHRHGHIFLLSDLFLVCERMTPGERARGGSNGPDMWLCYPPLSGKVLRASEAPDQGNALHVAVMRKETLILQTDSIQARNAMLADFKECIEFASTVLPTSKDPPPPVPPLNGLPRSPSAPLPSDRGPKSPLDPPPIPGRTSGSTSPTNRSSSPGGLVMERSRSEDPRVSSPRSFSSRHEHDARFPSNHNSSLDLAQSMSNLVLSPEAQMQQGAQRVPAMHEPLPGPMYPGRTSSTAQTFSEQQFPSSTSPGQVMPPPRHESIVDQHSPSVSFGPGQIIPPSRSTSVGSSRRPSFEQAFRPSPSIGHDPNPHLPPGPPSSFHMPNYPSIYPLPKHPVNRTNQQPFPPQQAPYSPPRGGPPGPSLSDPFFQGGMRKSQSSRSLRSQYEQRSAPAPPMPPFVGANMYPPPHNNFGSRSNSYDSLHAPQPRPVLPSAQINTRQMSPANVPSFHEPSPPNSPIEETSAPTGPVTNTISAQMKCKVFLKQHHAQWKSLGSAKLKLYRQQPTNVKQLVVEADTKANSILISTIVLTDGVERVGKTGVAIELSDQGSRTGIVYMIQLRNETSAGGLFDSLLAGSDRAA